MIARTRLRAAAPYPDFWMHLEVDRTCELCLRPFTVSYDFVGERAPCARDTVARCLVPCPRCGHANSLHMVPYAANIVSQRRQSVRLTRSLRTA